MLAIIVINYNKYEKTFECIESIRKSNFKNYKIYLLENGSTNNSYEKLRDKYKDCKDIFLIESKENLGYANGNNLCIEYAIKDKCKYALISNNDIIYNKNTILELYKEIIKDEYFIVAPKVILPNGKTQITIKDKCPSFMYYLLRESYIAHFLKKQSVDVDNKREVYWVAGCCFVVNLKLFNKIEYFDKETFLYYEEYIISEKAKDHRFKILYNPNISVIHHHGASMGDVNTNIFLEHFRSEIYFWRKYKEISDFKLYVLWLIRNLEIKYSLNKRKRSEEYNIFKNESKKILLNTKEKIKK